ncbi:hypothetical protein [Methylobacterium oxalidis]|uniref:Uncharacterized protein n=1 Tax=Methylobacterium oxalidis TaxID=944322 RepID=A0A512JB49_9HYPH|nr:hypothetical protein [Methylobacterium oxalidis]GEP07210.1 hypothetical protein MOX02_52480 [Methylobacterium oxalidis]GJE31917.1 hypothetical protein LDDCCGHA_2099 [Methylobacterium oxalidis]GLS67640.1 hypothetical protein GCM10007888_60240 [Methylobacterium oxalidis]
MTYTGPHIILDAVTYRTLGRGEAGRIVTIREVAYQGVMERRSDGFTVLSVLKPGASRTFSIEVGAVLSMSAHGRVWNPETQERRWRLRAEELRAFVEEREVAAWAQPYFDPARDKHHLKQPASKVDRRPSNPAERAASSYRRAGGRRLDEEPTADPLRGTKNAKPGVLGRLWRGLLRKP